MYCSISLDISNFFHVYVDEMVEIVERASRIADDNNARISFQEMIQCLQQTSKTHDKVDEGPDPKVLQFLMILEEYRVKCEEEGNYLEASRAFKQLGILRKQEEKRQQKVIQARHISERQDVQLAHNIQFQEFNKSWDRYMEEYDNMAQMYIQQMTERHSLILLEFQKQLRQELASKPPKWSKELMDQRRKQHINARNKNYVLAQKLKKISDMNELKERKEMEQGQAIVFAKREVKFRMQQQTELQALLKRIDCRRKEHLKQRELDTKRLLQRNRNVQAVLENKQAQEAQKLFAEIKKTLYSNAVLQGTHPLLQQHGMTKTSHEQNNSRSNVFGVVPSSSSFKKASNGSFTGPSIPSQSTQYDSYSLPKREEDHALFGKPIEREEYEAAGFAFDGDGEAPHEFTELIYDQNNSSVENDESCEEGGI